MKANYTVEVTPTRYKQNWVVVKYKEEILYDGIPTNSDLIEKIIANHIENNA